MTQPLTSRRQVHAAAPNARHECARGAVQRVDTVAREIAVLLPTGLELFYVPPDCPIYLHGERIKLRMIQPRDQARVTFARGRGTLSVQLLEVQPDSTFACFRL